MDGTMTNTSIIHNNEKTLYTAIPTIFNRSQEDRKYFF